MQPHHLRGLFAQTLRAKPEDAITTVLAELMRSPEVGLRVVRALLDREDETLPTRIDTQWTSPGAGRPDMRLSWPDRAMFIESKFWAPLQPEQIAGYPLVMSAEPGEARLCFVAPNVRKQEIMNELAGVRPAPEFLAWEHVHARLETIETTSERTRMWLDELIAAIHQEACLMFQPVRFTQEDIERLGDVDIGRALAKGLNFINEVRRRLDEYGHPLFKPSSPALATTTSGLHYGFYLEPANSVRCWLGFSLGTWIADGAGPLGFMMWYEGQGRREPPFLGQNGVVRWDGGAWATLPLTTDDVPTAIENTLEFLRLWRGRIDAL